MKYKNLCKQVQLKLKGMRYAEVRLKLRQGVIDESKVCSDEYLQSKTVPSFGSSPASAPKSGMPTG